MSTATETQSPPELTIFNRVASIPLISSGLGAVDGALASNVFTRSPYTTAKGFSSTAYKYTEPLQIRLAPYIARADGYANKAVDVVESRYPYPFKAKPEEVATLIQERRQSAAEYVNARRADAVNVANKTIDDKVKTPAYNVAQGIDQRFAPIVDYFEVAVTRLDSEPGPSTSDSKYQYQRALALSNRLKDHLYVYSNEQLQQVQKQSILAQRAAETAHSITLLASTSITSAQSHIHSLSENMLCELQKLQSSTASLSASLQSSAQSTLHNSTTQLQSQIPPQIQQTFSELSASLSSTVTDLHAILTTRDMPLQEKVSRVGQEVRDRVSPLLESVRRGAAELLARGKTEASHAAESNGTAAPNGNVHVSKSD